MLESMKEKIKKILFNNPRVKKTIGIILIIWGILALFTPFTPGSWLVFIGLEFFGVNLLFLDKIRAWFKKK